MDFTPAVTKPNSSENTYHNDVSNSEEQPKQPYEQAQQEQIESISDQTNPENNLQTQFPPKTDDDTDDSQKSTPKTTASQKMQSPEIVDKSQGRDQLHPIQTTDKLTSLADQEEEEFIEGVETAHEHP